VLWHALLQGMVGWDLLLLPLLLHGAPTGLLCWVYRQLIDLFRNELGEEADKAVKTMIRTTIETMIHLLRAGWRMVLEMSADPPPPPLLD
jgi:hypothetical protein